MSPRSVTTRVLMFILAIPIVLKLEEELLSVGRVENIYLVIALGFQEPLLQMQHEEKDTPFRNGGLMNNFYDTFAHVLEQAAGRLLVHAGKLRLKADNEHEFLHIYKALQTGNSEDCTKDRCTLDG